jgi:hypothetical protein
VNARKTSVRIRDLLGEKQAMAGDGLGRIVVRLGELSWDAKSWEGSQGDRDLVGFQIRACEVPPCWGGAGQQSASITLAEIEDTLQNTPKAHVGFDQEEVADAARVRGTGGRFEHIPTIFRMKYWRRNDTFFGVKQK